MNRSDKAAARNKAVSWIHQMGPEFYNALGPSGGTDNNTLVDYLVRQGIIYTPLLEQVFRAVDRGNYCPDHRGFAYKDVPWAIESLDLFAPSVYSKIMEYLEVKPGLSFLNLGSGSGYLNTMAGLILGPYGINHGIELYNDNVKFANERLHDFIENARAIDEYDFCVPSFFEGNCFLLDDTCQKYDRVFCGAGCPEEYVIYMRNLIKVGGILVMPLNHEVIKFRRIAEDTWSTTEVLFASFGLLITPPSLTEHEHAKFVKLGNFCPPTLMHICRSNIRAILRKNIDKDYPYFKKFGRQVHKTVIPIFDDSDSQSNSDFEYDSENITKSESNINSVKLTNSASFISMSNDSLDSDDSQPSSSKKLTSDELKQTRNHMYLRKQIRRSKACAIQTLKKRKLSRKRPASDDHCYTTCKVILCGPVSVVWKRTFPRDSDSEIEVSKNDNIAKEKDNVKKDIEDDDTYTEHMIKRIASLPLPSSLIKYVNNDRNNL